MNDFCIKINKNFIGNSLSIINIIDRDYDGWQVIDELNGYSKIKNLNEEIYGFYSENSYITVRLYKTDKDFYEFNNVKILKE